MPSVMRIGFDNSPGIVSNKMECLTTKGNQNSRHFNHVFVQQFIFAFNPGYENQLQLFFWQSIAVIFWQSVGYVLFFCYRLSCKWTSALVMVI